MPGNAAPPNETKYLTLATILTYFIDNLMMASRVSKIENNNVNPGRRIQYNYQQPTDPNFDNYKYFF
jgi:hypothetical protein